MPIGCDGIARIPAKDEDQVRILILVFGVKNHRKKEKIMKRRHFLQNLGMGMAALTIPIVPKIPQRTIVLYTRIGVCQKDLEFMATYYRKFFHPLEIALSSGAIYAVCETDEYITATAISEKSFVPNSDEREIALCEIAAMSYYRNYDPHRPIEEYDEQIECLKSSYEIDNKLTKEEEDWYVNALKKSFSRGRHV